MTVRPFVSWPDKRLRTAVPEVAEITDEIRLIWADMVETMDAMPGVGLAAPQIGVMMQLAVVDASPDRKRRILLANPTILSASEEMNTHDEASPNLLGVSAIIIEDKTGLKKNSLFGTEVKQTIDSISAFSKKIKLGKKAKATDEFMIIARLESLILNRGIEDAIKRAKKYIKNFYDKYYYI